MKCQLKGQKLTTSICRSLMESGLQKRSHLRLTGIRWSKQLPRGFPLCTCRLLHRPRWRHRWSNGWSRRRGRRLADVVQLHGPPPRPWTISLSGSASPGTVPWTSPFHPRRPRRTAAAAVRTPELRSQCTVSQWRHFSKLLELGSVIFGGGSSVYVTYYFCHGSTVSQVGLTGKRLKS